LIVMPFAMVGWMIVLPLWFTGQKVVWSIMCECFDQLIYGTKPEK